MEIALHYVLLIIHRHVQCNVVIVDCEICCRFLEFAESLTKIECKSSNSAEFVEISRINYTALRTCHIELHRCLIQCFIHASHVTYPVLHM